MTSTVADQVASAEIIEATLPEPLARGWNRLDGVTVEGTTITINPDRYFFRYQSPTWRLCDWEAVHRDLLDVAETPDAALEQQVLDYIGTHGQPTDDPGRVLAVAWHVYSYLFRDEHLADPELGHITRAQLRMLREMATMMALNRVELSGEITTVGPRLVLPGHRPGRLRPHPDRGRDPRRALPRRVLQRIPPHRVHQGPRRPRRPARARLPIRAQHVRRLRRRLRHRHRPLPCRAGRVQAPVDGPDSHPTALTAVNGRTEQVLPFHPPPPQPTTTGLALMEQDTIDTLFNQLSGQTALNEPRREPVRAWTLSGVERIHLPDARTMFFKHAADPFTREADVLAYAALHSIPVPHLIAAVHIDGALGMLLEDLGPEQRTPTITDAGQAAAATHRLPGPDGLPTLDQAALAALPANALANIATLQAAGRWNNTADITDALHELDQLAPHRADGADLPPFGLCHSEFHPTSLHTTPNGWRLLDWARAFHGPGLLDLASWQDTTEPPDLAALGQLIHAYIAAGGPKDTQTERGGLPVERWAYGWHRIWVIDWFIEQSITWIPDPTRDPLYQQVTRRHLDEALTCLR